ncbi:MAG: alkaline phosphatase [Pseudomonadota bacterium]
MQSLFIRPRNIKVQAYLSAFSLALSAPIISAATLPDHMSNTWYSAGQQALEEAKKNHSNNRKAKNVILIVGDGMGVSTVTAARILEGQLNNKDGEKNSLSFEKFPHLALSKTYSANQQTSDSAPTMTAMVTGVKTNDGVLSASQAILNGETDAAKLNTHRLETILEMAEKKGLKTGVISTARITHATPAATYAHTSTRDWETNKDIPANSQIKDIASQLIDNFGENAIGDGIEVVFGGGRSKFIPITLVDPEDSSRTGERTDGRNLTTEWKNKFAGEYIWNKAQFDAINLNQGEPVLGLFERSHMEFEADRKNDVGGEPSLAEMTSKAIDLLENKKGFFLMIEAGRIDHGHHAGNAYRALTDTIELSNAVKIAREKTNSKDTLIIVTADHSHTFTIAGYPKRGNPILGKVIGPGSDTPTLAADNMPYTTLSYANGLGYHFLETGGETVYAEPIQAGRFTDLTSIDTTDEGFHQEALVPLSSETHAGEDVAIFASGPKSHLFQGVKEQNYIFHVMHDAFDY